MEPVGQDVLAQGAVLDGQYQIGPVIGRGGMATVYEGRQLETGHSVAIKLLRDMGEELAEAQRRFFNELLSASALRHPRIVEVHDFGVSPEGARYIVMERLQGHTIGQELRRFGRMDPDRSIPRMLEALDALQIAHERGIIHSDLKPTNLFLCHPGTAREALTVLDFGVAHRFASGQPGRGGTPRYAPPELLLGGPTLPATDVYQLGLVLAEMLSGEAVLSGVTTARQCLERLSTGPVRLPLALLESDFREVVEVAVSPDPRHRFRDANELREALVFAWLRHKSGGRTMLPSSFEDGTLEADEIHTVRFQDGMEEEFEYAPVVVEEAHVPPPAPLPRRTEAPAPARRSGPARASSQGWIVALAVVWTLTMIVVAAMAGVIGALMVLQ